MVLMLLASACDQQADTLTVAETIPLGIPGATLHIDSTGHLWVGGAGDIRRLSAAGVEMGRYAIDEVEAPAHFGSTADRIFFRTGGTVAMVRFRSDSTAVEVRSVSVDAAALDARGNVVLRTEGHGTVVAHDGTSLEPTWGWGAVGAASHAIAISPEGDRVYQSVATQPGQASAVLLVRDLFTGRILREVETSEPIREIVVGSDKGLWVAAWQDLEGSLSSLTWDHGELRTSWRRTFDDLGVQPPVRLEVDPDGGRVAVLARDREAGLLVLATETGRTIARFRGEAADVAFGPAGSVYLLDSDGVNRLE